MTCRKSIYLFIESNCHYIMVHKKKLSLLTSSGSDDLGLKRKKE